MTDAQAIKRVTLWGLFINVALAILKAVVGELFHSSAAFADAIHSLSDSITDFAVIFGVKYWSEPADENHPHGHQRIEAVMTLFIGLLLGLIAAKLAEQAIRLIGHPATQIPGWPVAIVAAISMVVKEILYHWTRRVGEEHHSSATIANAWHHRSDAFSSIPVAVSAVLSQFFPEELPYLDPVATTIVALMLLKAAGGIAWPAILELTDSGATADVRAELLRIIKDVKGVKDAHGLRTRRVGDAYSVDVHILVVPTLTVKQGHAICSEVSRVLETCPSPKIVDVLTHLEPWDRHELEHP